MRKRSDVGAGRQQDLDAAAKLLDQTPAEARAGIRHYECSKCHARQSAGIIEAQGGKCIRCGEAIPVGADVDPWKLRPESVQATKEPEKAPPPAQDAPRTAREAPGQAMGGEVPFTELEGALRRHGFSASLPDVAGWTPEQRGHARIVCEAFDKGQVANVQPWLSALRMPRVLATPEERRAEGRRAEDHLLGSRAQVRELAAAMPLQTDTETLPNAAALKVPDGLRDVGELVTASWGEEKFTPVKNSFSVCTVGPFVGATRVRPGETRVTASQRVLEELREVALIERDRKLREFVQKLRSLGEELRAAGAN